MEEPGVLAEAVAAALAHDSKVVIEEAVPGFEVGCAVLGNEVLTVGHVDEIELSGGFFNYTEKYNLITSAIHMPARISQEKETEIQVTAQLIYRRWSVPALHGWICFSRRTGALSLTR